MCRPLQSRSLRLLSVAASLVFGMATIADAQCSDCTAGCIDCRPPAGCCPIAPGTLEPTPALPEADPDTPLTTPEAAPPAPGDSVAFDPLQSTLLTSDTVAVPNMMGNLLRAYRGISFQYLAAGDFAVANSSGAVSFRNAKVADNNSAIPRDRVSFRYNYFHNALTVRGLGPAGQTAPIPAAFAVDPAFIDLDAIAAVAGESRVARGVGIPPGGPLPLVRAASRDYDVHLYTFSAEKTFFDDLMSLEIRIPFAHGLDESQDFTSGVVREDFLFQATPDRTLGASGVEFQDVQLILKGILLQDPGNRWVLSGGLGLSLPTGPDLNATVVDYSNDVPGDAGELAFNPAAFPPGVIARRNAAAIVFDQRIRDFKVKNETVGLSPFLAMVMMPSDRVFMNGFFQIDVPLNRSDWQYSSIDRDLEVVGDTRVIGATGPFGFQNAEAFSGRIRDQMLMQLDIGGGYWLYQNPYGRGITGLASILELHYTTTLEDADIVTVPASRLRANTTSAPEFQPRIGNIANNVDILDLTVGAHFLLGRRTTLAVGGVFPLRDGDDRTFDAEFTAQLNIYR